MEITGSGVAQVWTAFKNSTYALALFTYTGLSHELIGILAGLMVVDTITGVLRSYRIHGGNSITSSKLGWGVVTKMLFLIVPFVIVLVGKGTGYNLAILADWAIKVMVLSEGYSIISNITAIHLRKDIPEFDAMTFVLNKVRDTLRAIIEPKLK